MLYYSGRILHVLHEENLDFAYVRSCFPESQHVNELFSFSLLEGQITLDLSMTIYLIWKYVVVAKTRQMNTQNKKRYR